MKGAQTYDQFFFESYPTPERHIDRLYMFGQLAGLTPTVPAAARVLEIGCSTALNLIPQAQLYPESRFVGIDLSAPQIQQGSDAIRELGLANIRLEALDLRDFEADAASFDYIICHGLYSWTADEVRDLLMQRIGELLSPKGIAYLSFNTLSGWKRRTGVREMVRMYDIPSHGPQERVSRLRSVVATLLGIAGQLPGESSEQIQSELHRVQAESDAILIHEYLNPELQPFSLVEIVNRAKKYQLNYLADARQRRNIERYLIGLGPGTLRQQLERANRAEREDFFDSVELKSFRGALLTKLDVPERFTLSRGQLISLHISSPLVPVELGGKGKAETFMMGNGAPLEVADVGIARMLHELYRCWPRALPLQHFPDGFPGIDGGAFFMQLFWNQMIELSYTDFRCTAHPGEQPRVSHYARYQASRGGIVPTLRHEYCVLNAFERQLMASMDGTRNRGELADQILQAIAAGALRLPPDTELGIDRDFICQQVENTIQEFAERGMICA